MLFLLLVGGAVDARADALAAGLSTYTLDASRKVRISVQLESRCMLGDFDAINLEMSQLEAERDDTENTEVLLSVEPLDPTESVNPSLVKYVSRGEVDPTSGAVYELPSTLNRFVGGIYLCIHQQREGFPAACRQKDVATFSKIFESYQVKVDPVSGLGQPVTRQAPIKDKIYFFQPILIVDNQLYYPSSPLNSSREKALNSFIREGFGARKERSAKVGKLPLLSGLASVPLKRDGDSLSVMLPFYDEKKCGQQRIQ